MAQIRIAHSLSDGEKRYLSGRRPTVQQCLVKNNIPCTLKNVPNIAILGSGGGERAMVGMLGSLYQMGREGLLDAALYMSGVSGSTWCMASVYERPSWSSDIEELNSVAERIGHGSVSIWDRVCLLKKYHRRNANFSWTDIWAALVVPEIVKKIDESTLSNYQTHHDKDPYPIYTIIDQDCKYNNLLRESFFELTPHEAGYSLAGAFVETSSFGSIFNKGVLKENKPEMDLTYLQGVCGSAFADKEILLKALKDWLENQESRKAMKNQGALLLLHTMVDLQLCQCTGCDSTPLLQTANDLLTGKRGLDDQDIVVNLKLLVGDQNELIHRLTADVCQSFFDWYKDENNEEQVVFVKVLDKVNEKRSNELAGGASNSYYEEKQLKALINIVRREAVALQSHDGPRMILQMLELYYHVLTGEGWTQLIDELNLLLKGKYSMSGRDLMINKDEWVTAEPNTRKQLALGLKLDICKSISSWFPNLKSIWDWIVRQILRFVEYLLNKLWIWGTNYNFLHDMKASQFDRSLLMSGTRHFEDASFLVNSPYMSVLRAERKIDLIISFDFSERDPMATVRQTSTMCKDLGISFPVIEVTKQDENTPKDFYVFKGLKKAPTVIHIPLFNVENCGSELSDYREKYRTFQGAYGPEMVEELMKKAGENVINNKKKLLSEIASIISSKQLPCECSVF